MVLESLTIVVFPCTISFLAAHMILQYCQLALMMALPWVSCAGVVSGWFLATAVHYAVFPSGADESLEEQ